MNPPDSEANFKKVERNPLQELAKLRLEIAPDAEEFDINCQLRFSAGEVCVMELRCRQLKPKLVLKRCTSTLLNNPILCFQWLHCLGMHGA